MLKVPMKISRSNILPLFLVLGLLTSSQSWADPDKNPTPSVSPSPVPFSERKIPYSSLSSDEREVLDRGEVGETQYIVGGVIGTLFGLGIGQAIEQRYVPTGLIITVGEAASIGMMSAGAAQCVANTIGNSFTYPANQTTQNCNSGLLEAGIGLYVGLRIWEIIDVWATPPSINRRYRDLKEHVDRTASFGVVPAVATGQSQIDGALLAYQWRF
jgi:hypothetical protein